MILRRRNLPPGWYPEDSESIGKLLGTWIDIRAPGKGAKAAIAPHAGWAFSGRLAALAASTLAEAETVAVIGGHLPGSSSPMAAFEDAFETPLGAAQADAELRTALSYALSELAQGAMTLRSDEVPDNTVEVQLPLVKARFPGARVLWLRAPNGKAAVALGEALAQAAAAIGRKVVCLGSTDLTHYGPAYDFAPAGRGPSAERWVREVNDRAFVDALLAMDPLKTLERGQDDQSACSPGAAAATIAFARGEGAAKAELLAYATSLDVRRDESFVGYAAVAYY